jgi:hypothetical protein
MTAALIFITGMVFLASKHPILGVFCVVVAAVVAM